MGLVWVRAVEFLWSLWNTWSGDTHGLSVWVLVESEASPQTEPDTNIDALTMTKQVRDLNNSQKRSVITSVRIMLAFLMSTIFYICSTS